MNFFNEVSNEKRSPSDQIDHEEEERLKLLQEKLNKLNNNDGSDSSDDSSSSSSDSNNENSGSDDSSDDEKDVPIEIYKQYLKNMIDLKVYQTRLKSLDTDLELETLKEKLRTKNEINEMMHRSKKREFDRKSELYQAEINLKNRRKEWKSHVHNEPQYLLDPVVKHENGDVELVMSDRIINLNGAITYYTSEYITDRIHYYNNQNPDHPIFLVIDYSPGGSVMSGYRILQAMSSSQAPVYVVVKSFAASMAATITTMSKHSFVYPNAIIMHHQIWSRSSGNLRQHEENLADLKEWWRRLAEPMAKRLGITTEEWRKQMYEHNSDGDWNEFGDRAVALGWADSVVHRLRETGQDRHPDKQRHPLSFLFGNSANKENDKEGNTSNQITPNQNYDRFLPELRPFDFYWMHNPKGYYQICRN